MTLAPLTAEWMANAWGVDLSEASYWDWLLRADMKHPARRTSRLTQVTPLRPIYDNLPTYGHQQARWWDSAMVADDIHYINTAGVRQGPGIVAQCLGWNCNDWEGDFLFYAVDQRKDLTDWLVATHRLIPLEELGRQAGFPTLVDLLSEAAPESPVLQTILDVITIRENRKLDKKLPLDPREFLDKGLSSGFMFSLGMAYLFIVEEELRAVFRNLSIPLNINRDDDYPSFRAWLRPDYSWIHVADVIAGLFYNITGEGAAYPSTFNTQYDTVTWSPYVRKWFHGVTPTIDLIRAHVFTDLQPLVYRYINYTFSAYNTDLLEAENVWRYRFKLGFWGKVLEKLPMASQDYQTIVRRHLSRLHDKAYVP